MTQMTRRANLVAALERARETVRTTKALAGRMTELRLRDLLVLEAVALQSVIDRIERRHEIAAADMAELHREADRLLSLAKKPGALSGELH